VTVCASCGNLKVTWELCARKANNYFVANFKIASAANNPANILATICGFLTGSGNSYLAPANSFSV
jgi:hypothetical protein